MLHYILLNIELNFQFYLIKSLFTVWLHVSNVIYHHSSPPK